MVFRMDGYLFLVGWLFHTVVLYMKFFFSFVLFVAVSSRLLEDMTEEVWRVGWDLVLVFWRIWGLRSWI